MHSKAKRLARKAARRARDQEELAFSAEVADFHKRTQPDAVARFTVANDLERREAELERQEFADMQLEVNRRGQALSERQARDPQQKATLGRNMKIIRAPADIAADQDALDRELQREREVREAKARHDEIVERIAKRRPKYGYGGVVIPPEETS